MAWIESHQELARHPKTKRLSRLLGISTPAAVGHLHFLWWWAMDYAQDGELSRYDDSDIADACEWDGDPKVLVSSFVEAGFIDETDDGLVIHDWFDYAGRLIEKREQNRERKRRSRAAKQINSETAESVTRLSRGQSEDDQMSHRATQPNPTIPNQTISISSSRHSAHSVFGLYEREIGPLTEITTEILIDLETTYGEEKVKEAIKEAVRQGVKKLSYIEGILQNKPKPSRSNKASRISRPSPQIVQDDPGEKVTDEEYERVLQKVRSIEGRMKARGP